MISLIWICFAVLTHCFNDFIVDYTKGVQLVDNGSWYRSPLFPYSNRRTWNEKIAIQEIIIRKKVNGYIHLSCSSKSLLLSVQLMRRAASIPLAKDLHDYWFLVLCIQRLDSSLKFILFTCLKEVLGRRIMQTMPPLKDVVCLMMSPELIVLLNAFNRLTKVSMTMDTESVVQMFLNLPTVLGAFHASYAFAMWRRFLSHSVPASKSSGFLSDIAQALFSCDVLLEEGEDVEEEMIISVICGALKRKIQAIKRIIKETGKFEEDAKLAAGYLYFMVWTLLELEKTERVISLEAELRGCFPLL